MGQAELACSIMLPTYKISSVIILQENRPTRFEEQANSE